MRHRSKQAKPERVAKKEPLAEGLRQGKPYGFYKRMSDDEMVAFAMKLMEESSITTRRQLREIAPGLERMLGMRGLLSLVLRKPENNDWVALDDEAFIQKAQRFIDENGIRGREGLRRHSKEGNNLYEALRRRGLKDRVSYEADSRRWSAYSDEMLIRFAQSFIDKGGIQSRNELHESDSGLAQALQRRRLMRRLRFSKGPRLFCEMPDQQLVEYAKELLGREGIRRRADLHQKDNSLYRALLTRRLIDIVFQDIECNRDALAVKQVVDALEEFP